ncbi:DsbA family protein [Nocardioides sp.]|uniref:mycothiol-dependent nitroreductase Rv2466c family protein n=1 Tax=Nocardioides sp. TaxID=35761 RepID=UPI003565ABD8
MTDVDFWFDPRCPFAWVTSQTLLEVEKVRDVSITWHVMSMAHLNKDNEALREKLKDAWQPVRVCMAAEQRHGKDALLPLYAALARRRHVDGREFDRTMIEEALTEAGLPTSLAEAMDDSTYDAAIKKSHHAGMDLLGPEAGSPALAIDGIAFFGPVLTQIARGEDAGRMWDGVVALASLPHFAELKRPRDPELKVS